MSKEKGIVIVCGNLNEICTCLLVIATQLKLFGISITLVFISCNVVNFLFKLQSLGNTSPKSWFLESTCTFTKCQSCKQIYHNYNRHFLILLKLFSLAIGLLYRVNDIVISGGSRISRWGGGTNPKQGCDNPLVCKFLPKTTWKWKNLVGGWMFQSLSTLTWICYWLLGYASESVIFL